MWFSKKYKRGTQVLLLACVAGLATMALAGSALAAPASNSQQVSVASGTADLGGFTLQAPVPVQAPDHPANVELLFATALSVTMVPLVKLALQVAPQLIPPGLLMTVPPPVPAGRTVS